MGVPVGEAEGEFPGLLWCRTCEEEYETDETMSNECPHCNALNYDKITPTEEMDDVYNADYWRD